MDFEQHGADRNHKDSQVDEELHWPARDEWRSKPNAGLIAPVPVVPHAEWPKFNPRYLFRAEPPGPAGRLVGAVGGTK